MRGRRSVPDLHTVLPFLLGLAVLSACSAERPEEEPRIASADTVRIALFNIKELSAGKIQAVSADGTGADPQLRAAASIIRRVRPDILVINEIDHGPDVDAPQETARLFAQTYLAQGDDNIVFEHTFAAPNNTGLASGLDLNNDGLVASENDIGSQRYGDDAFGFGVYPGQYSMAVLSTFPISDQPARTFQRFRWTDLPNHHMPKGFFTKAAEESLRLSSKSHWDLPVQLPNHTLHVLLSHPTPPVFDGEEDRNGRRNFDEIGFWSAYLNDSWQIYDDEGVNGGYNSDDAFVIAGDLNARPDATDGIYDGIPAVVQLLQHERVQDTGGYLTSRGALQGRPPGPPSFPERSTAVFGGGWRIDYLLPSTDVTVIDGAVYWPDAGNDAEGAAAASLASDHRLVWLDLVVGAR